MNADAGAGTSTPSYRLTIACAVATAALAPAYVIRWHIGFYPTTLLEAAILTTLAVFAIESWRARAMPSWRGPLLLPTLVFLLAGAISVVDAPGFLAALGIYRAYLVEPAVFALALVTALKLPRQADAVLVALCAGASVLAVLNVVKVLAAFQTHTFNPVASPPVAVYTAANSVALFLVPLIAVAASVAIHGTNLRLRLGLTAFVVLATVTTILTFSRGGWVALAAVAVGLALSHRRRWPILGGLAAAGVALTLIPAIHQRIAYELLYLSGRGAFSGRLVLWSDTLQMLESRPILGAGLSGFSRRMAIFKLPYGIPQIYPHNLVLDFWSETGLLGLFAFTAIMVIAIFVSWHGWRTAAADRRPLELGVLLALAGMVVHGLVDNPYFKNDLAFEFWVLIALSLAGARPSGGVTRREGLTATASNRDPARRR